MTMVRPARVNYARLSPVIISDAAIHPTPAWLLVPVDGLFTGRDQRPLLHIPLAVHSPSVITVDINLRSSTFFKNNNGVHIKVNRPDRN